MAKDELDDDRDGGAPPKRGIPRWAWITCGGGCLLALVTGAVLLVGGYKFLQGGMDAEQQWPKLARILPFDERPPNLVLEFGFSLVQDQYHLRDTSSGIQAIVTLFPARESLEQMLDPDPKTILGLGKPVDPEPGELELQGKTVRCLRFSAISGQAKLGPGIRIDLGPLGDEYRAAELHGRSVPSDDEVRAFFEPFDVWRE